MTLVKLPNGFAVMTDEVEPADLPEWASVRHAELLLRRVYPDWRRESLPADWRGDGYKLRHLGTRTTIIVSASRWDGQDVWVHASISHPDEMPSYEEMVMLHRAVFGERFAYQVFAPRSRHVNYHEYCLHLWGRADDESGAVLPDFGRWGII